MSKAYLVWTGCYSDSGVVAVCTTRERADAIAKWILEHDTTGRTRAEAERLGVDWFRADGDARVEEIEMDAAVPGSDGRAPYSVVFDKDGNVQSAKRDAEGYLGLGAWFDPPAMHGPWSDGRMEARVRATDGKHAIKIASDLRAAAVALGGSR